MEMDRHSSASLRGSSQRAGDDPTALRECRRTRDLVGDAVEEGGTSGELRGGAGGEG